MGFARVLSCAAGCLLAGATAFGEPAAAPTLSIRPEAQAVAQATAFRRAVAEAAAQDEVLTGFYRDRDFEPLWTGATDAARRASLFGALARAADHGLPARRYDLDGLQLSFRQVETERDRALLEVQMTRAFLRFAQDLHGGVLVPQQVSDTIKRTAPQLDRAALLTRLQGEPPATILREVMPTAPEYGRLLRARHRIEAQIAAGGWGPEVRAESLRPGDSGNAVIALRNRLMAMGWLDRSASASYDTVLQSAVQRFQAAHGIEADGIAGPATLRAINVGAEARLGSVLAALERERWLNVPRGDRHIWVNLVTFNTQIIDRGQVTFETISIIGERREELQTPEFSELMTYMEINPDWTIPRGIIGRSYLPALQSNPYAHGQLQILDAAGRVVDRGRINFARYSAGNLPFTLRQPPGPSNPLGKVKFMFPNPWAIYLHDTPTRDLFRTESRAHSNGCIRLHDPEAFAHILLARQVPDPVSEFDRIHRSGQQTRVYLDDPVPVHLVYRTAFTDVRGGLHFRPDVYGRDALVLDALRRAGVDIPGPTS